MDDVTLFFKRFNYRPEPDEIGRQEFELVLGDEYVHARGQQYRRGGPPFFVTCLSFLYLDVYVLTCVCVCFGWYFPFLFGRCVQAYFVLHCKDRLLGRR